MTHGFHLARAALLLGLALLMLWLVSAVSTGTEIQLKYPRTKCGCCCVPNAVTWGYYPTIWRRWPGEDHLLQDNPRALHSEVIRTTGGFKTPVLKLKPKPAETPEGGTPGGESAAPGGPTVPSVLPSPGGPATPGHYRRRANRQLRADRQLRAHYRCRRTWNAGALPSPGGPAAPGTLPPPGGPATPEPARRLCPSRLRRRKCAAFPGPHSRRCPRTNPRKEPPPASCARLVVSTGSP